MPTIYLAGPFQADEYRRRAKQLLEGYHFLDPFRDTRDFRGREDEPGIHKEIVHGDLLDIEECDGILANFSANSVGTSMECWFASDHFVKPIVCFVEPGNRISPWVTYIAHNHVVWDSVEAAAIELKQALPRA